MGRGLGWRVGGEQHGRGNLAFRAAAKGDRGRGAQGRAPRPTGGDMREGKVFRVVRVTCTDDECAW
ncbi:hypothetical protein GCM10009654_24450 [Streptomyces hebeiensis]|uniref:Uncharacterized protein n=1 Tax=Streptomyces hebeiensis TaxID=229486 RepID=A0ABN1USS6_9ACTN